MFSRAPGFGVGSPIFRRSFEMNIGLPSCLRCIPLRGVANSNAASKLHRDNEPRILSKFCPSLQGTDPWIVLL